MLRAPSVVFKDRNWAGRRCFHSPGSRLGCGAVRLFMANNGRDLS
jgi:hypothetical protein